MIQQLINQLYLGKKCLKKKLPSKEPLGPMLTRTSRAVGNMLQKMFLKAGHDVSPDEMGLFLQICLCFATGSFSSSWLTEPLKIRRQLQG